jgi:hypothetical protein
MYPPFIIASQILSAFLGLLRGRLFSATEHVKYAMENIEKIYFNGNVFMFKRMSTNSLRRILDNLRYLLLLMFSLGEGVSSQHLIIFDMLGDVSSRIRNRLRLPVEESRADLSPESRAQPSIESLMSPIFPDFSAVLSQIGLDVFQSGKERPRPKVNFELLLRWMKRNVRLCYGGQLEERRLYDFNAAYCKMLELGSNMRREVRQSVIFSELPKSVSESVVFVCRVFGQILSYFPFLGRKNIANIECCSRVPLTGSGRGFDFDSESSLFPLRFLGSLSNLLSADLQGKRMGLSSAFADQCCEIGKTIFGGIEEVLEKYRMPLIEDDFKDAAGNGKLVTLHVGTKTLTIVADNDLQCLPFEFMFPSCCVVRARGFFSVKLARASTGTNRPMVLYSKLDHDNEHEICVTRSREVVLFSMNGLGVASSPPSYLSEIDRFMLLPFPLFEGGKSMAKYSREFQFCDFVKVRGREWNRGDDCRGHIFVLTYLDLVEWPPFVDELAKGPLSCFLFVPGSHVGLAFAEMKAIYRRHKKRLLWLEQAVNVGDSQIKAHKGVLRNPFQFVATMQTTLMKRLNVPVVLVNPNRSACE